MPPLLLLLCLALVTGDQPATATTATATRHHEDDEINAKMERYVALLRRRRDAIDKFLKDNYSDFNHSDYTPEEYVSHPINAYMLMKRTTVIWQAAKKDILDPSSVDLYKEIQEDIQNFQKHQEL